MSAEVLIDGKWNWKQFESGGLRCWFTGDHRAVRRILDGLGTNPDWSLQGISRLLREDLGNFGLIAERGERVCSAVDKIRSYPLFYYHEGTRFCVSNSARALRKEFGLEAPDPLSLLEFRMSGYVTGRETAYKHLYQLQAGECLVRDGGSKAVHRDRYYRYLSETPRSDSEEELIDELGRVTDGIFRRLIDRAKGATVWVPLSGGLDSRLVLCKLKELGYDRLQAFSYGPPGNYEAKAARYVAQTLDVPWVFVPTRHSGFRKFFHSSLRKEYWAFCDGLCSVPNMQDMEPILDLRKKDLLGEGSVLVNGQSGDFITGGHIPALLVEKEPSVSSLLDAIIGKHFSLWQHLKTDEALQKIRTKILRLLECPEDGLLDRERLIALYEWWEWQERQCKYVVNGQRVYDFLGLSWELPLWDDAYLRFWRDIPLHMKFRQDLYRRYLRAYNYRNLFKDFSPTIWHWPGLTMGVVAVAQVVGWVLGRAWKEKLYKRAGYFGHYGPLYAGYGFSDFLRRIATARNAISFYVDTWFEENGLPLHSPV
jgi:asparagine synthase (glutamine-hydrolysing)